MRIATDGGIIFDRPMPATVSGTRARVTVPLWQLSDSTMHPHAGGEARQLVEQLVVDQLAVVEAPGLVLLVVLFAADVRDLAAMARIGEEEQVARRSALAAARIALSTLAASPAR